MKKKIIVLLVCGVIAAGLIGCGNSEEETEEAAESDAAEDAAEEEEYELIAEFDEGEPIVCERLIDPDSEETEKYSILDIPQSEATMDYITDWYENYVIPEGHDWDVIVYSDREDNLGVWADASSMSRDVYLIPDDASGYTLGDNSSTSAGYELQDGELVEVWSVEDENEADESTSE